MKISQKGVSFIKGFESFVPYVYDDQKPPVRGKYAEWDGGPARGTLTIGYGHTNSAKHPLKISKGLKINETRASEILDVDLDECEDNVNKLVKVPITQGQFDALVSFAFNCGVGNLKKLIVPLNKGDYDGTRRKFDLYVRASGGGVMKGLVRRRDGEQALWDASYDSVSVPSTPIHHVAEVEADVEPTTSSEGILQKASLATPVIGSIAAAFTDWKIVVALGAIALIGAIVFIVARKRGAI